MGNLQCGQIPGRLDPWTPSLLCPRNDQSHEPSRIWWSGARGIPRADIRSLTERIAKAHEFVLTVYSFTASFPKQKTYGLALQMRRAAVSIPANIAEGFRRRGKADKARFMNLAEGSIEESRYYLVLASDLGYGDASSLMTSLEEVSRLLTAYTTAILTSSTSGF